LNMRFLNLVLITSILIATTYIFSCPALSVSLGEVYPPPPQYVDIINSSFVPDNITVPLNTTVVWSNHDENEETVTAVDGSFSSRGIIPAGFEYRYIFLQPGWYEYYSRNRPSMRGLVIVEATNGSVPPRPAQLAAKAPAAPKANATTNVSGSATSSQAGVSVAQGATVGLIAKNIAYNRSTITVPAGANVTVNFDNQDSGIPHNFAVYETSAAQSAIFKGEIITGPAKTTYTFTAPSKPGTYFFRCDVHPTQMTGQFVVTSSTAAPASQKASANASSAITSAGNVSANATKAQAAPKANATSKAVGASAASQANLSRVQATTAREEVPPIMVEMSRFLYNPDNITVTVGTTVSWVNYDGVTHTVTADDGSFDSGNINPGQRFNHTFTKVGEFSYHDKAYPFMRGNVNIIYYTGLPKTNATLAAQNAATVNASVAPSSSGKNISANASSARVSMTNASANMAKAPAAPAANVTANATGATAAMPSSNASGAQSATIGLIAKNIAFNTSTITVPAGANITVNFDNQDSGIPHNFAVYETSAAQNNIFKGDIITGPKKTTYTFTAPDKPGTYFFRCDVHPTQMNGQFTMTI
jgi:plastocyanin